MVYPHMSIILPVEGIYNLIKTLEELKFKTVRSEKGEIIFSRSVGREEVRIKVLDESDLIELKIVFYYDRINLLDMLDLMRRILMNSDILTLSIVR